MRHSRSRRSTFAIFDMTPMIDVVLQLIIFFMYTSQFAQLARTPIDMPEEIGDENEGPPSTVAIDLDATGAMFIEGEPVTLDEIERLLLIEIDKEGDASRVGVLIRADRSLPLLHVNALGNRLAELGLRGWQLGTNVPMGVPAGGAGP